MQDKQSIGATPQHKEFMEVLVKDLGMFALNVDAAKFAMALAIRRGCTPEEAKGAVTAWSVSTFDPDQTIKGLISALYPEVTTPYHFVEALVMAGLDMMHLEFQKTSDLDLSTLLTVDVHSP